MYVIVEGIDGAGKTTLVRELAERLRTPELFGRHPEDPVLQPRLHVRNEPSSDGAGFIARDYFKRTVENPDAYHPLVAAGLMIADRAAGTTEYRSWIDNPRWLLLSDRGFLSTLVYQGMELAERAANNAAVRLDPRRDAPPSVNDHREAAFELLLEAHANIPMPDLIIFLACDPDGASARALRRRDGEREHLTPRRIHQASATYIHAMHFLRNRWLDAPFAIIPTSRPGGERETSVSIPTAETVEVALREIETLVARRRVGAGG